MIVMSEATLPSKEEEEPYIIEFQPRPRKKPSEWLIVPGLLFREKERAEEQAEKQAEELGVPTRVTKQIPIYEEWNFRKLMGRLEGSIPALREMKRRGEAGAIAGHAIYKRYVKGLLKNALSKDARDEAFRTTMVSDLEAVGEDKLVEEIEGLHRKYPKGIPDLERSDVIKDWDDSFERRAGRTIPKDPRELTREDIEESKRITKEMWTSKATKKTREEKVSDLERMKKQLKERLEKLKKK